MSTKKGESAPKKSIDKSTSKSLETGSKKSDKDRPPRMGKK